MLSKFLPDDFDPSRALALIAGKDTYPERTIASAREKGIHLRLLAFEGETKQEVIDSFPPEDLAIVKIGQLGKMLKHLDKFQVKYAMMIGQITPRRLFQGLHPDVKAIKLLSFLNERNAETIYGGICDEISSIGVQMLDARSFLDHELAQPGLMTGAKLKTNMKDVEHGIKIAKETARLNIGQSVVVSKGTVIAVEAYEGTDNMLRRAGSFDAHPLLFIKTIKPNQDFRFDIPVFGLKTLGVMREAKIDIAVLESEATIILEKDRVIAQAKEWKIQLFGF